MDFFSITGITLLIALIVVFAIAVVTYMSSLVKNAYEMKVEMRSEMEDGMRRIDDENEKRLRGIKREMLDEVAKAKVSLDAENVRRFNEVMDVIKKQITDLEEIVRRDRDKATQSYTDLHNRVMELEHIYQSLVRVKKAEKEKDKDKEKQ